MLIDKYLFTFHFNEFHAITTDAAPEKAYQEMINSDLSRSIILRLLFFLKSLKTYSYSSLRDLTKAGFIQLDEKPGEEVVYGIITQSPSFSCCEPIFSASEFINLNSNKIIKAVINFAAEGNEAGSILSTETRVWCGSREMKKRFQWYWLAIRPFSGLARKVFLKHVRKRLKMQTSHNH